MFVRSTPDRDESFGWVVQTPAKINLALEVIGRRQDGFHEVETLLAPVRLFDTLAFRPSSKPLSLVVHPSPYSAGVPGCRSNLALSAALRLAEVCGREATGRIELWKRIPNQAGLGGGSSDAAAALVAANQAWEIGYSRKRLEKISAEIGTDVPFFLQGGAALGTGRGERTERVALPAGIPLVIMKPPVSLSTPKVFDALGLRRGHTIGGTNRCKRLIDSIRIGAPKSAWRPFVQNSLQQAAERLTDWIGRIAHVMSRLPVLAHQLTGSGSGYFAICPSWRAARQVAARLVATRWEGQEDSSLPRGPVVFATRTGP